ncbi:MAG: acetylornithine deacetylase/succinyl-diaminopimelate desuccinylase family protein [Proteobacteria bacterium]|nr:acetylornithine deacetylase/succinyl-diaminopimelate desuccinylase family protein [Pseudomonadota bacterium]
MKDQLLARIDSKRADLIDLTRALVQIPSVNPPGDGYQACCDLLSRRLKQRGFDVSYHRAEGTPGDSERYPRINLVATRPGARSGPCVHFNSHIDVVEPGVGWSYDPFGAEQVGSRIYGRGTCDMKGGLAASIIAIEALIEIAPDHPGTIEISGTADEETGGFGGVAYLAGIGLLAAPRVDHVIIPEPLNKDRICLGHRGVWWTEIETHGRIAHGSMPFLGDCAVRHMQAVMAEFESTLFPYLATKTTTMPVVPDGAKQSTLNINSIHGGLGEQFDGLPSPLVPDSCRMVIDRRFLIEEAIEDVKAEVKSLLDGLTKSRRGFTYHLNDLFEVIPTMTDQNAPVVRAVHSAVEEVLGQQPTYVVSPGTYDQKHFDRIGLLKDCIAYGPGILDLAHQVDEYVDIVDMLDSAKVMALACANLLGVER